MELNTLLKTHDAPGKIAQLIYKDLKAKNSKFSLQYICSQSGVSSKGYLSDVMSGKRKLKVEYARPLAKTLGLKGAQSRLFHLLTQLERSIDPNRTETLKHKIHTTRKSLELKKASIKSGGYNPLTLSKVFCAFGVNKTPSVYNICDITKESLNEVTKALTELVKQDWIYQENNLYSLNKNSQVRFTQGDQKNFHKLLIENSLKNSIQNIDRGFEDKENTFFESSVISVNSKKYQIILKTIKEVIEGFESELETEDADKLIHFNVQIFPNS